VAIQSANHGGAARLGRAIIVLELCLGGLIAGTMATPGVAQERKGAAAPQRLTIPYLANATKPDDLDFAAAQCDLTPAGEEMACRFRQVFLTIASIDPATCVMTTNGYEQTFHRESATRWVNTGAPAGECATVETTTLDDGGGVRWTMTVRRVATKNRNDSACLAVEAGPERYSWQHVKRKLPCTSIQPGAIER
jgi:hypothetical protein